MLQLEEHAVAILAALQDGSVKTDPLSLSKYTNLDISEVIDALAFLEDQGALEVIDEIGNPLFVEVIPTGKTKYLYQKMMEDNKKSTSIEKDGILERPINPIGSPYGFEEENWESVATKRQEKEKLYVVFGLQFKSKNYDTSRLLDNIKKHFENAIMSYNIEHKDRQIELEFIQLSAGLGEHLFNQIASDIIGSDIAVFDTSDQNPNVMIELGVALTWGVPTLPIREVGASELPSDISGQTWIKYEGSGDTILDADFNAKLLKMITRAIKKKGRQ